MNDKVLPFLDEHRISALRVLTDRGAEYCGRVDSHPYQLYLALNEIVHSKTKARHPQTNGSCEKLNQTIVREFYAVTFRKKLYTSLEDLQRDLDKYNKERTNQGKRCNGRTTYDTFIEGVELYRQKVHESQAEEEVTIYQ